MTAPAKLGFRRMSEEVLGEGWGGVDVRAVDPNGCGVGLAGDGWRV